MKTQVLSGHGWTVEAEGVGPVTATVPGCVHDALSAAALIPDPDSPGGEQQQRFIGRTDWTWRTSFEVSADVLAEETVMLVFDSVDTVGVVRLNGVMIGEVSSQFIPYRFAIKDVVHEGRNDLEVVLVGTLSEAERMEGKFGPRPVNADGAWGPFSQLRKSACNFGWDWGPCCPTCGFAGDVRIEASSGPRIMAIRPHVVALTENSAELHVDVDVDGSDVERRVVVRSEEGDELATASGFGRLKMAIANPPIWWPRGMGEQALVTVEVELDSGDQASVRTGLRTVEIDRGTDGGFTICVNGVSTFCRGANWIPSKLFPHNQVAADVVPLLEAACDANMNMIRVWGGGIYEPSWFYEQCDELGLMVWQDFMFACATYPEHDLMQSLVADEARSQIARLASHPSIVLWCGGNEDVLAWYSWGWREQMSKDTEWGRFYWEELLPQICRELDPSRPYWTESPWSGSLDVHPNDPDVGDRHTWDLKIEGYRELVPRFVSEFGHQAPPTQRTIEEMLGCSVDGLSPSLLTDRQRAWGGDEVQYAPYLKEWFGFTASELTFDHWLWATQLLQARAIGIGCGWLRANSPRCAGALIWQLNDVWTGHSWSLLDVRHRPKPVFYAVQQAFAPQFISIEPVGGALSVVVSADQQRETGAPIQVQRVSFDGTVHAAWSCDGEPRNSPHPIVTPIPDELSVPSDASNEVLVASMGELKAFWFFEKDDSLRYPAVDVSVDIQQEGTTAILAIRAQSFVRDLCIQADSLGPSVRASSGMITLLPDDECIIHLTGVPADLDVQKELGATTHLIRTANELFM